MFVGYYQGTKARYSLKKIEIPKDELLLILHNRESTGDLEFNFGVVQGFFKDVSGGVVIEARYSFFSLEPRLRFGNIEHPTLGPTGPSFAINYAPVRGVFVGRDDIVDCLRNRGRSSGVGYHATWIRRLERPYVVEEL